MKMGIFTALFDDKPLEETLELVAEHGYEAVELPAHKGNNHLDIDKVLEGDNATKLRKKVESFGLDISAISNHVESQLVLGPHNQDTDHFYDGTPEEKIEYGIERIKKTARAANALEVPVVVGFSGCEDFSRWFPWPDEKGWEKMEEDFVDRWSEILDEFSKYGVKFAMEAHPKEIVYNIETAERSIELLDGVEEWGFNFDPANLIWQGLDVVNFVQEFGERIYHVHAKDGEIVEHNVKRSGLVPHGDYSRLDRGFRFRVPGWGSVPWKRILTELSLTGYDYVMSFEHEDPAMSRMDGVKKAIDFLKPLFIENPFEGGHADIISKETLES